MIPVENKIKESYPSNPDKGVVEELLNQILTKARYSTNERGSGEQYTSNYLESSLTSNYPSIEFRKFTAGARPVIRGTRIPVSVIVGYLLLGEKPETIANEILRNISVQQIYEAKEYYLRYRSEINKEIFENSEAEGRKLSNILWSVTA